MFANQCHGIFCFVQLSATAPKFFGFSEFLAGLALNVLAWTIADIRYKFRIETAPIPLQRLTFWIVAGVGMLTLLTDLWRAHQWWVPRGNLITPESWQALLGGLFLITFLTWAWFAFIRPPVYGRLNSVRYARVLFRMILRGSPSELTVIADEFIRSVTAVIGFAPQPPENRPANTQRGGAGDTSERAAVVACAESILLLIADKRFCRAIVESSPATALALFQELATTKKYKVRVEIFGKNLVSAALANKDSFLFHEEAGYHSGYLGYFKPLSQAIFSNYAMVEAIGTLLDADYRGSNRWDATQWETYFRCYLLTFKNFLESGVNGHSFVLYRGLGEIGRSTSDLYRLNGMVDGGYDNDILKRLKVAVDCLREAVELLDAGHLSRPVKLRGSNDIRDGTFYDYIANSMFEVIFAASNVVEPSELSWWVQYNSVWSTFFNFTALNGPAGRVIKFKLRRLLYDEVVGMKVRNFPNFKGAKILAFCLNIMGLREKDGPYDRDSRALHIALLRWIEKNFVWLHLSNSRVAEASLPKNCTFDASVPRLIRTFPAEGLRINAEFSYLNLDNSTVEQGAGQPQDQVLAS